MLHLNCITVWGLITERECRADSEMIVVNGSISTHSLNKQTHKYYAPANHSSQCRSHLHFLCCLIYAQPAHSLLGLRCPPHSVPLAPDHLLLYIQASTHLTLSLCIQHHSHIQLETLYNEYIYIYIYIYTQGHFKFYFQLKMKLSYICE